MLSPSDPVDPWVFVFPSPRMHPLSFPSCLLRLRGRQTTLFKQVSLMRPFLSSQFRLPTVNTCVNRGWLYPLKSSRAVQTMTLPVLLKQKYDHSGEADRTWAGPRSTFANIGTKKNLCLKMSSFNTHDIVSCSSPIYLQTAI